MIHYRTHAEARTWYVVFDKPRSRKWRWWRLFTRTKFSHVWAFSEAGAGVIRFEPLAWGQCVTYEEESCTSMLEKFACSDCTAILSITVDYRTAVNEPRRGLYNCVTMIKALLALQKCPFTLTPFALYKRLCLHEGCIPIKAYIPYVGV